jgi:hypothetical protein
MQPQFSIPQMTRAERETEAEASRLIEQIEGALAAVALRSSDEIYSLEAAADRIERASRDLADALRGLARERHLSLEQT